MELIRSFFDVIVHLDSYLTTLVAAYGPLTYAILFGIVFAETGFVVTPFLPGDSLLFAAGALAGIGSLNIVSIMVLFIVAAFAGDNVNYWIGHYLGRKIVDNPKITFINQEHIDKTEQFYKKYGVKTIILARFVPIVRTFSPFVAGVGAMHYATFLLYSILGATVWVTLFCLLGYFFGNLPFIQDNFHYAVFMIIAISLVPLAYEYIQHKRHPNVRGIPTKKLEKIVNK
jgi:membrane-associated protein